MLELTASGLEPQEAAGQVLAGTPDFLNKLLSQNGAKPAFSLQCSTITGKLDSLMKLPGSLKAGLSAVQLGSGSLTIGILVD
ncbi:MAG: hypothetical protein PHQ23_16755 [Candidatus Wallbacteria bacterium]|nr:hypothetical protein [Candidatus Wallbacteria bacterium]